METRKKRGEGHGGQGLLRAMVLSALPRTEEEMCLLGHQPDLWLLGMQDIAGNDPLSALCGSIRLWQRGPQVEERWHPHPEQGPQRKIQTGLLRQLEILLS